ncbi:Hypothetical predicted protein [Olea europaea subsp. europaea]|uniref:Uncharacterized protein n=1 Tax=Olea europaea subsp. europaea TaxID=158383 RepID=A0A8S0UVY9_OLEEU|nr:Hypothetical predicted protein [Olea europaea subsp. europaea]
MFETHLSRGRQFLGHGVQVIFETRWGCCRDALDFQAFLGVFGTQCVNHVQDAAGTQLDLQAFLGSFWDMFVDTVCRPCPGCILAAVGTQLDFQAFLSIFWDSMCKPCSGRVMAMAGTESDFQAIYVQFLGHGVQSISRMRQGRILTFRQCPGCVWSMAGMQPGFQAIFRTRRAGLVWAATRMQPDFQAFLGSFQDMVCRRCPGRGMQVMSGRVRATQGQSLIFRQFAGTVCRPSLRRILAAAEKLPDF